MLHVIAYVLDRIRVFFAPRGKHRLVAPARATAPRPPTRSAAPVTPRSKSPRPAIAATVRAWYEPIDGAATQLVRPYIKAYERDEKARIQRLRRDTLWCATYGIDLDTRDIHSRLEAA